MALKVLTSISKETWISVARVSKENELLRKNNVWKITES